jgi:rod shape-determining protein MreD
MMPTRDQVLLPANRGFIFFSLICAFLLNILPWARLAWVPDFLALTLLFWNIYQPRLVGIGIAFLAGLLMDVHNGALLGESALAYSVISYGAIAMHRRVPWFSIPGQMMHVFPLFLLAQCITLCVRLLMGAPFPGWLIFSQSVVSTAAWPIAMAILFAPQRRPVERDENRPI